MAIVFPDVEAAMVVRVKAVLSGRTEKYAQGAHVSNVMPKTSTGEPTRKDRMVIIRDDSGNQLDVIRDLVRIGVQFWGPTREDAKDLAELCRALLNERPFGPVKRIRCVLRPAFVEDAQPMFYATFELIIWGKNL